MRARPTKGTAGARPLGDLASRASRTSARERDCGLGPRVRGPRASRGRRSRWRAWLRRLGHAAAARAARSPGDRRRWRGDRHRPDAPPRARQRPAAPASACLLERRPRRAAPRRAPRDGRGRGRLRATDGVCAQHFQNLAVRTRREVGERQAPPARATALRRDPAGTRRRPGPSVRRGRGCRTTPCPCPGRQRSGRCRREMATAWFSRAGSRKLAGGGSSGFARSVWRAAVGPVAGRAVLGVERLGAGELWPARRHRAQSKAAHRLVACGMRKRWPQPRRPPFPGRGQRPHEPWWRPGRPAPRRVRAAWRRSRRHRSQSGVAPRIPSG